MIGKSKGRGVGAAQRKVSSVDTVRRLASGKRNAKGMGMGGGNGVHVKLGGGIAPGPKKRLGGRKK